MTEMTDGILELASELRRLRLERGAPTYENLARKANVSRSTVADAFSGTKIPSERTLFGIVSALGEAPEPWLARRKELVAGVQGHGEIAPKTEPTSTSKSEVVSEAASGSSGDAVARSRPAREDEPVEDSTAENVDSDDVTNGLSSNTSEGVHSFESGRLSLPLPVAHESAHSLPVGVQPAPPSDPSTSRVSSNEAGGPCGPKEAANSPSVATTSSVKRGQRSLALALVIPLLVIAALAGAGLSRLLWPAQAVPTLEAGGTEHPVEDGADIWDTGCIYDAIKPGADRPGEFDTQLGLRVSLRCKTIWGVLYRNDGGGYGNQIRLLVYPKTPEDPGTPQEILVSDQDYAVTAMILQEDLATDQYCVEAWIIEDGVEISLGEPLCA